jgi:hypothetical protein
MCDLATGRRRNTKYTKEICKDRRGDAVRAALGRPFDSIDIISFDTI